MSEPARESATERLERYLKLANEARDLALRSRRLEMRESCLEMAAQWLAMAAAAEREPGDPMSAGIAMARDERAGQTGAAL
jgi:hypothetical protein